MVLVRIVRRNLVLVVFRNFCFIEFSYDLNEKEFDGCIVGLGIFFFFVR